MEQWRGSRICRLYGKGPRAQWGDHAPYFFVIRNGTVEGNDQDGTPLQDDEDARNYANRIIRELKEGGGYDEGDWALIVFAEGGRQVCSVPFATVSIPSQVRKVSSRHLHQRA